MHEFKPLLITYKALRGHGPACAVDLLRPYSSSWTHLLFWLIHALILNPFDFILNAVEVAAHPLWNRSADSVVCFKWLLIFSTFIGFL